MTPPESSPGPGPQPAGAVVLYQAPPAWELSSISPFCSKVEAYLRLARVAHRVENGDPRMAPKGKVPFLRDGTLLLGDSQLIIEHLKRTRGDPLDERLLPRERAMGEALRRMLEEGTYWISAYARWWVDAGFRVYAPCFADYLPPLGGSLILWVLRGRVKKQLWAQGTARHSAEEVWELGKRDLDTLAELLDGGPFLFGDAPCTYDLSAYAILRSILGFPVDSPLRAYGLANARLVAYDRHVHERAFGARRAQEQAGAAALTSR